MTRLAAAGSKACTFGPLAVAPEPSTLRVLYSIECSGMAWLCALGPGGRSTRIFLAFAWLLPFGPVSAGPRCRMLELATPSAKLFLCGAVRVHL